MSSHVICDICGRRINPEQLSAQERIFRPEGYPPDTPGVTVKVPFADRVPTITSPVYAQVTLSIHEGFDLHERCLERAIAERWACWVSDEVIHKEARIRGMLDQPDEAITDDPSPRT